MESSSEPVLAVQDGLNQKPEKNNQATAVTNLHVVGSFDAAATAAAGGEAPAADSTTVGVDVENPAPPKQPQPYKVPLHDVDNNNDNGNNRKKRYGLSSARSSTGSSLADSCSDVDGHPNNPTSTPPTPQPPMVVQFKSTKAPKETLAAVYKAGEYKAGLPLNLLCIQAFMAGIYIAMAGHLYLAVGGGLLGSALFPTGLIAVVLTSAELFTGDALVFVAGVLGRRVKFSKLVRNWTVAWFMNFAGCLFWGGLIAYASNSIEDLGVTDLAVNTALKKANQSFGAILLKGIGANFMVCIGVWQATCAEEVAGKCIAIWFPIAAFVMMGFDHCIANMFLIPIGMWYGADV